MKLLSKITVTCLLFSAVLFSCKKDETPDEPKVIPPPTWSASVGGQAWALDTITAEYRDGRLLLLAEGADGRRLALSFVVSAAGTTAFSAAEAPDVLLDNHDGKPPYLSQFITSPTGNLVLSELNLVDSVVSGEFTCKVRQTQTFTADLEITAFKFDNLRLKALLPSAQKMSATVPAAVGYSPFLAVAYISPLDGSLEMSLVGTDMSSQVALKMSKNINPGNYVFTTLIGGGVPSAAFSNSSSSFYDGSGGSLKVVKHDKTGRTIEGTFAFNGVNIATGSTLSVTNGTFAVSY